MYVGGKLCYLAGDTKRDPKHLFSHTRPHPLGVLLCSYRHLFVIRTYFCRSLIPPTSSRFPARLRRESKTALYLQPRNSQLLARHIAWPTWEFIRRNYAYEFVLDKVLGCGLSRKFLNDCLELLRCQWLYESGILTCSCIAVKKYKDERLYYYWYCMNNIIVILIPLHRNQCPPLCCYKRDIFANTWYHHIR